MSTHNICLYKEVDKKVPVIFKTMKSLDCALIGVCAVIRSNTVYSCIHIEVFTLNIEAVISYQTVYQTAPLV